MAEEEKAEKEEEQEESKEKEKKEEESKTKTIEKIIERDREPSLVDCPECDLSVRDNRLGSHRWKAHQVERREDHKKTDDKQDDGIAPKKKPTTKPKEEEGEKKREPTGLFGAWRAGEPRR